MDIVADSSCKNRYHIQAVNNSDSNKPAGVYMFFLFVF